MIPSRLQQQQAGNLGVLLLQETSAEEQRERGEVRGSARNLDKLQESRTRISQKNIFTAHK